MTVAARVRAPASPMAAPADMKDAVDWAIARLREAGVVVTPSIEAYARSIRRPPSVSAGA